MKKLIFVRRQYSPFGGAEVYQQQLMEEIEKKDDFNVALWHIEPPKWLPSWLKILYYNWKVCNKRKKEDKENDKIYFSSDRLTCLDFHHAGGGTHKSFLKTKGFSLNPLHPTYLWIEKKTLKKAKHIIAVSNMVKEHIIKDYDIPEGKITVIYNGANINNINEDEINRRKSILLKEFPIAKEKPIILFVGSGFKRKGVEEFLHILSKIESTFHAFVVGKEKKLKKYIELSKHLQLENKVTFTGPRKDVENFYAASDIFLFPTHYEPFGLVVLEAMGFGNAIITTESKYCGASELLKFETKMNAPDDYSIVSYINQLLNDSSLLYSIQQKNMQIAKNYTIEKNAEKIMQLIKDLDENK